MLGWMDDTAGSQVSIMATVAGDANLDGVVDDKDASAMGASWLTSGTWQDGDFNYDGAVNDMDAAILAAHWGSSVGGAEASVPEPSTLAMLLGAAVMAWLVRRRSR